MVAVDPTTRLFPCDSWGSELTNSSSGFVEPFILLSCRILGLANSGRSELRVLIPEAW